MPATLPLIAHADAAAPFAQRRGSVIAAGEFLAQARALADALPARGVMLDACRDRYAFSVAFAAAQLRGHLVLLPNTLVRDTLDHLAHCHAGLYLAVDGRPPEAGRRVPVVDVAAAIDAAAAAGARAHHDFERAVPRVEADRVVASLFTSGSTGTPTEHPRCWASVVASARAEARRLGLASAPTWSILGTVPAQHSFGFESTVMLAWHAPAMLIAEHPFYPADVRSALAAAPRPRLFVTTPVHLRALAVDDVATPRADLVLSATAPLSAAAARAAEARFGCPLVEIYGSTESGQLASRRTVAGAHWESLDAVSLASDGESAWASGGHVPGRVRLGDRIDVESPTRFILHGRVGDMVNVAGKRGSLAFVERCLLAVDGVREAALLVDDDAPDGSVRRLTGFVVAPGRLAAQVLAGLRDALDPAFVPRPLWVVDELPRDGNGKVPREALRALAARLAARTGHAAAAPASAADTPVPGPVPAGAPRGDAPVRHAGGPVVELAFAADAPFFAGHFPGRPMVPGAKLLERVLAALPSPAARPGRTLRLSRVKFLAPVGPGDTVIVAWHGAGSGWRFECRVGTRVVASGSVAVVDSAGPDARAAGMCA